MLDGSNGDPVDKARLIELHKEDREKIGVVSDDGKVTYEVKSGVLYQLYRSSPDIDGKETCQVLVPTNLRQLVMEVAHDSIFGGHMGVKRTMEKIMSNFYWPGFNGDVTRFCRSCDICQKTIQKGRVVKAPLEKMPLVDAPFKHVAVDLVGLISPPSEKGHQYILTLVDYKTRYPEAIPLKNVQTETVAEALVDIYSRLGIPEEILSDQGSQFISQCMQEVSRLLSIKRLTSSPYHNTELLFYLGRDHSF